METSKQSRTAGSRGEKAVPKKRRVAGNKQWFVSDERSGRRTRKSSSLEDTA